MYLGLARVCSIVCVLLVMAFIIGSVNVDNLRHDKKHNTLIESNVVIKPRSMPIGTVASATALQKACDASVASAQGTDESKANRTLRIPKEHLMVRSGYQQLGRLAFIYAYCLQHIKKMNCRTHVSKAMQVATRQLVALNQQLLNQYIMHCTKYQARVRGTAGKRVA